MQALFLRRNSIAPRAFQQACRISNGKRKRLTLENKKRPPLLRPPTKPQIPQEKADDSIRWFEQDVQTGAIVRVDENPEEKESRDLRQQIKALEEELKGYESDDDELSERALLENLEPHEREKVVKALQEEKDKNTDRLRGLEISLERPPLVVPVLKRLNAIIILAAQHPTQLRYRKLLWRWYCRAKHSVPGLSRMMPEKAWQVLWKTQSVATATNPDRQSHIIELTDDIVSMGQELSSDQKNQRLQALVFMERVDDALNEWETDYDNTAGRDRKVLERGITLFANIVDIEKAIELLRECFENHAETSPRIILPLVTASAQADNDHVAYALYLYMRSQPNANLTMQDYDTVILAFLEQDKTDLALAVFRDMMLQGSTTIAKSALVEGEEDELYRSVFTRLGALRSHTHETLELNKLQLHGLSALPVKWQNKFFYGSWLKKLIGMNEVVAAAKVVELMFERGVIPDARHMNGLISAFMRSGQPGLQERAEMLGWTMIQRRMDFVHERDKPPQGAFFRTVIPENAKDVRIPIHIGRPMPAATLETFNVMATHYLVQEKWAYIRHLKKMMRPAAIRMDAYFMNHLLYTQLYTNRQKPLWNDFLYNAKNVEPDTETFNCLWTAELREVDIRRTQESTEFPFPRRLFGTMVRWHHNLDGKRLAKSKEDFTMELYAKIIQSFCFTKDLHGCLVAMHGIVQVFGVYPDADIARLISEALSNLPVTDAPTIRGRRRVPRQLTMSEQRNKSIADVLAALAKRRAVSRPWIARLEPGPAQAEESLNLLSELIRVVLVRSGGDVDSVEPAIEQTSIEMGLPGIGTGDVDASNVA